MPPKITTSPRDAWRPIDQSQWTDANIRHLLRRASWTARPVDVIQLRKTGLEGATDYLFGRANFPDPHPVIEDYAAKVDELLGGEIDDALTWAKEQPRLKEKAKMVESPSYTDPYARPLIIAHYGMLRKKERNNGSGKIPPQFGSRFGQNEAWVKFAHEWLKIASQPRNAAFEKLNGFLQNVLVVNHSSLRGGTDVLVDIHNHQRVLRDNFYESYTDMCKRMYKTRGMGKMLDIIGSTKSRPNENFARELQELFVLGVDNGYTEDDIKEASKAFTGYVVDPSLNPYALKKGDVELTLDPNQHNDDRKKVYGRARDYDGDALVDLVFTKDGAETHLPKLLSHEFLVEGGLPDEYLKPLGKAWRDADFNVFWLIETFFKSRLFYDPAFRGRLYKSPFQFYLGLLQDLGLQVEPSIEIVRELDYLGQPFSNQPDVNGWEGGAFWMNNGTVNARRLIVQRLFAADYRRGMMKTSTVGAANYVVTDEPIRQFLESGKSDREAVDHFITYFVPIDPNDEFVIPLREHLAKAEGIENRVTALKQIILSILQSQYYQVC